MAPGPLGAGLGDVAAAAKGLEVVERPRFAAAVQQPDLGRMRAVWGAGSHAIQAQNANFS